MTATAPDKVRLPIDTLPLQALQGLNAEDRQRLFYTSVYQHLIRREWPYITLAEWSGEQEPYACVLVDGWQAL